MSEQTEVDSEATDPSGDDPLGVESPANAFWAIVSLEPVTSPVKTWRGTIHGTSMSGCASKAVRAARKAYPGTRAKSIVIVLEKVEAK
jgi:hypothetical protein